jgi:nicotinamide riboside transporter PnuC
MDSSSQAEAVIGAGRSALIGATFGTGWLGWGLGTARAFNGFTAPAFGFMALFLIAGSAYFIRHGRQLRKRSTAVVDSARRTARNWFLFIVLMEALAIVFASILANRIHRADLATNWCAMIVGLHFLPLARIFRAPQLIVRGILITVWCVFCWAFFRSNALVISTSLGTGLLLWGSCVFSWLRARKISQSIDA